MSIRLALELRKQRLIKVNYTVYEVHTIKLKSKLPLTWNL